MDFTEEQIKRYSRHIILPEVGGKGQKKIINSRMLVVGAGGLGSPALFYLAAAGVGTIAIAEMDTIEISNLQRQILHTTDRIGELKSQSAKKTINALNPDVNVVLHEERLTSHNILKTIDGYDVVVDGCDNFATRYLVNDACVMKKIPNVHGSIFRFEGQATFFAPFKGPCYRCLYPTPPPAGLVPSCQEAGVMGVLPGIIGSIQATEALKYILDIGESLIGRLLTLDALTMQFRVLNIKRDPACPICGDNPTIKELVDYEEFCALPHN
ncbi:molybdopterin-synthase adenylyltransferase MoeB [Candidatus Poribacteria bacterium]|nr:molybdopterin-synthase adenylyltransferase MoeB [Candidatus Poribacteria bacterium]